MPMTAFMSSAIKITPQDQAILSLAIEGMRTREIAEKLEIKPRTVKQHFRTLFLRAGITSGSRRTQLLVLLATPERAQGGKVNLAPREFQVLRLTVSGLNNKQTGERLGISESTVKNYVRVLLDKCGVWTRQELAMWWLSHSWQYGTTGCPTQ